MKKIQLKLNADLGGKKKGAIVTVEIDSNKVITDQYWRRRLEDAELDNCIEIVKNENRGDKK
jgi:hypothetical protein